MRELGVMGEVDAAKGSSEGLTLPPQEDLLDDLRARVRGGGQLALLSRASEFAHVERREAEVAEEDSDALVEFNDEVPDETEPERLKRPIAR